MAVSDSEVGKRLGNLNELPDELLKHLNVGKKDVLETRILQAIQEFQGVASVDEIIVAMFRAHGYIPDDRRTVANKLYKMTKSGFLESVPKKKGVFRLRQSDEL